MLAAIRQQRAIATAAIPSRFLVYRASHTAVADGIVFDYDAAGNVVGIEIDNGSKKVQLDRLEVSNVPGPVVRLP